MQRLSRSTRSRGPTTRPPLAGWGLARGAAIPALGALAALAMTACPPTDGRSEPLTAAVPLHLEDHLDEAGAEDSRAPEGPPVAVEWRFDEPQPGWKPVVTQDPSMAQVRTSRVADALRIQLSEAGSRTTPGDRRRLRGAIWVELADWKRQDWAHVLVRARTEATGSIGLAFNLREKGSRDESEPGRDFDFVGEYADLLPDGAVHTYALRADWSYGEWTGPWRELGLIVTTGEPGTVDLLSVSVIPKEARFAELALGVDTVARGGVYRRALYMHTPGRVSYRLRVPEGGRLDTGLGVLRQEVPVTFRVALDGGEGAESRILLEEEHADSEAWSLQSLDLTEWAGREVALVLEAESERDGTVALWAAPVVSGERSTELPNVILYVIDAGGADYMSVYGYNRRTTPNLEKLASAGAVFEHAYSNSTWSKTSTPSFMTGLQHSVLGGYENESDRVPDDVVTLPEHLRAAGYQTAVITSNPYAGTMSGLEQGVDFLRESDVEINTTSTRELHADFWEWRRRYPGEPYFVHFQTTDVHWPYRPPAPFAGTFVDAESRERFYEWERRLAEAAGMSRPRWLSADRYPPEAFEKTGIDRKAFYEVGSALYDEAMAHNDYQIGRLVERLKALGEWERTLLIVAADHGNDHGLGGFDPVPRWRPILQPFKTRVPLIFVWPERIPGGGRFLQPVSMIDLTPTILGLAGLPPPEPTQGQSLAPLLQGQAGVELQPVILEEAYFDAHSHDVSWVGIEIIDGRWGASLSIEPAEKKDEEAAESREAGEMVEQPAEETSGGGSKAAGEERPELLLYDLWVDPYCLRSLHGERPELAGKYREVLTERWKAHQELARRFRRPAAGVLNPEQLRTLRSLGYIQ